MLTSALRGRERRLLAAAPSATAPVFIVGPPRSGTTLLYELMVTRYHCAYFSRAAQALWQTPVAATRLARSSIRRWRGSYTSRYGQLDGWGAPHEAVRIWSRWMPGDGPVDTGMLGADALDACRRTVGAVTQVLDAPFVSKNPTHSVRIGALADAFPRAIFIEVRRRPLDTVRSILTMRESWHGAERRDEWLAVRPHGCEPDVMAGLDATAQVTAQVALVRRAIADGCRFHAPGRHIAVDYEAFCADPRRTLDEIGAFLSARGTRLRVRGSVPARFDSVVCMTAPQPAPLPIREHHHRSAA